MTKNACTHCCDDTSLRRRKQIAPWRLLLMSSIAASIAVGFGSVADAQSTEATSSRTARDEAVEAIPFQQLTEPMRETLWPVVSAPSMYRRMPAKSIDCDPNLYVFLVRQPEVIVNIWELMGATKASVERTGKYSFQASDGLGTDCDVQLVYGTPNLHVFYGEGTYTGSVIRRPVTAKCVLVLRSNYKKDAEGVISVDSQMDLFLRFDNRGADLIAKTVSPLISRSADINFLASVKFVGSVSKAAETNGHGVQRLASRLTKVQPEIRTQFARLTANVSRAAADQVSRSSGQTISVVAKRTAPEPPTTKVSSDSDDGPAMVVKSIGDDPERAPGPKSVWVANTTTAAEPAKLPHAVTDSSIDETENVPPTVSRALERLDEKDGAIFKFRQADVSLRR